MPGYLLDTSITSQHFHGNRSVKARIEAVSPQHLYITDLTVQEHLWGRIVVIRTRLGQRKGDVVEALDKLHATEEALREFHLLPYDAAAEQVYQSFPPELRKRHVVDRRRAAVALSRELV